MPARLFRNFVTIAFLTLAVEAHSALIDNGDGTVTDTVASLMWLKDANLAMTSGYDVDGRMSWRRANAWADGLIFAGYDDWHMPTNESGCRPYYCTETQMGTLFYNALEPASGSYSVLSNPLLQGPDPIFDNVTAPYYWQADAYPICCIAYAMTDTRYMDVRHVSEEWYAWAVREVEVSAVPIPAAAWLFGSGLLGLGAVKRKRR